MGIGGVLEEDGVEGSHMQALDLMELEGRSSSREGFYVGMLKERRRTDRLKGWLFKSKHFIGFACKPKHVIEFSKKGFMQEMSLNGLGMGQFGSESIRSKHKN